MLKIGVRTPKIGVFSKNVKNPKNGQKSGFFDFSAPGHFSGLRDGVFGPKFWGSIFESENGSPMGSPGDPQKWGSGGSRAGSGRTARTFLGYPGLSGVSNTTVVFCCPRPCPCKALFTAWYKLLAVWLLIIYRNIYSFLLCVFIVCFCLVRLQRVYRINGGKFCVKNVSGGV